MRAVALRITQGAPTVGKSSSGLKTYDTIKRPAKFYTAQNQVVLKALVTKQVLENT